MNELKHGRQRAAHVKKRSGCQLCKTRHRKCDETRPSCLNCTAAGRQCPGYVVPGRVERKSKAKDLRFRIVEFPSTTNKSVEVARECSLYDYFLKEVVLHISKSSLWPEWMYQVAFTCQSSATLTRCCLALAAVYRAKARTARGQHLTHSSVLESLPYYNYATESMRRLLGTPNPDLLVLRMCCAILTLVEALTDRQSKTSVHLQAGLMLTQDSLGSVSQDNEATLAVLSSFGFLEMLNDPTEEERADRRVLLSAMDWDSASAIQTINSAVKYSGSLCRATLAYIRSSENGWFENAVDQQRTYTQLRHSLSRMLARSREGRAQLGRSQSLMVASHLLHAQLLLSSLFIDCPPLQMSLQQDFHATIFNKILDEVEQYLKAINSGETVPLVSLCTGVISITFCVALYCANPEARVRSCNLLQQIPLVEGVRDAILARRILDNVFAVEAESGQKALQVETRPHESDKLLVTIRLASGLMETVAIELQ